MRIVYSTRRPVVDCTPAGPGPKHSHDPRSCHPMLDVSSSIVTRCATCEIGNYRCIINPETGCVNRATLRSARVAMSTLRWRSCNRRGGTRPLFDDLVLSWPLTRGKDPNGLAVCRFNRVAAVCPTKSATTAMGLGLPRKAGRLCEEIDIDFCVSIWPKAYFHRSLGHRPRNGVVHHPVSWLKAMFTLRVTLEVNMAVGQNCGFATIRPGRAPTAGWSAPGYGDRWPSAKRTCTKQLHQKLAQHRLPET